MKFSFSGRHMDIGASLTARAQEACETLAEKYDTEFIDVSIVMKKENHLFYTDMAVKTATGNVYQSSDDDSDPIASFLGALQKIDVQIRKKKKSYRGLGKDISTVEINSYDNSFEKNNDPEPMIIAEILDDLPLMSVSEATKKLTEKRRVFIFENISNNAVNVVYKREDGNFGWLDYKIKR
ncbi:MAG: HPF/RaiA family ribosome-associated protein [Alphaproteobacteria bacterium]|nr:HPF/RaiA family ribosome-associated protein [Alphaproteobacteria bacterium]